MGTSFHVSNFGPFGGNLPRDMDGYCHLTAQEWMGAPIDGEMDGDTAEEYANRAREAVKNAEECLAEWQNEN